MRRIYVVFAATTGAAFVAGIVWAMCAIFVTHDQTQVVAGVGLLGLSAVAGTGAFLLSLRPATVPHRYRASVVHVRAAAAAAAAAERLSCELDCEYESVMIATGDDTPPKVVYVERGPI
jgi:hypothetical protein